MNMIGFRPKCIPETIIVNKSAVVHVIPIMPNGQPRSGRCYPIVDWFHVIFFIDMLDLPKLSSHNTWIPVHDQCGRAHWKQKKTLNMSRFDQQQMLNESQTLNLAGRRPISCTHGQVMGYLSWVFLGTLTGKYRKYSSYLPYCFSNKWLCLCVYVIIYQPMYSIYTYPINNFWFWF